MVGRVLLCVGLLSFVACSGADPGPQGGGGSGGREEPGYGMPPSDNDSDFDDGSGWPRWKNPCPGPACDPYRGAHPEWIVDPPPDRQVLPGERVMTPNQATK